MLKVRPSLEIIILRIELEITFLRKKLWIIILRSILVLESLTWNEYIEVVIEWSRYVKIAFQVVLSSLASYLSNAKEIDMLMVRGFLLMERTDYWEFFLQLFAETYLRFWKVTKVTVWYNQYAIWGLVIKNVKLSF